MKKIFLVLSSFFAASLTQAAGGPIPGVNVSLEQIPGGVYHTQRDCTQRGGSIIHKNGKTYCGSSIKKRARGRAKLSVSDEGRHTHLID